MGQFSKTLIVIAITFFFVAIALYMFNLPTQAMSGQVCPTDQCLTPVMEVANQ